MATGGFELVDNNLIKEADDYIKNNRLVELFEDLASAVAYRQPDNLEKFLIERLELKKEQGLESGNSRSNRKWEINLIIMSFSYIGIK